MQRHTVFPITALLLVLLTLNPAWARMPVPPQSDQDALFIQAVDAYSRNQFPQALAKFQQVSGSHAQEAQQYIKKMNAYHEAIQLAKGIMDRSPDERDANSLEFAIQQYQLAIQIKPDGPWQPADQLAKARVLWAQVQKAHAASSKAMNSEFCAKALAAAQEHHYKEAAQYSCPLANDNPGYSCGGDEAVHMCQVNTDLAKLDKGTPDTHATDRSTTGKSASTIVPVEPAAHSSSFDKAKAAYDSNDFERARSLFQRVDADSKAAAADFLDKISRYTDAFATGEKQSRDAQYESARAAFASAAAIKPDGPGDPQNRASRMELFLGLDQFYSGDYASAIQHLQSCAHTGIQKQPLVHFYLGASELAKFFVTGSDDRTLHQDALNDLKQAKQAGFKTTGQDVSPKILQVYNDL
jgi:hypothetical protein